MNKQVLRILEKEIWLSGQSYARLITNAKAKGNSQKTVT